MRRLEGSLREMSDRHSFTAFIRVLACQHRAENAGLANVSIRTFLSYRLPQSAHHDPFVGFREMKRTLFAGKKEQPVFETSNFIFDSSIKTRDLRVDYLGKIGFTEMEFIARNELVFLWNSISLTTKIAAILKGVQWATHCLWSKNRVNKALFFRSLVEFICFAKIIDSKKKKIVFDFNQFEVDSNLFYVAVSDLFGENLVYRKFPSPGPLQLHNSILLADVLCYNTPYHLEEIKELKETIRCVKIERVPMEQFFLYADLYQGANSTNDQYALAYYSHASWLRKQSDHADDGLNILEYENSLLQNLDIYLRANPDKKLVIFTHPRERKIEVLTDIITYYKNFFQNSDQVSFCKEKTASSSEFRTAKIGIGVYSTILFERLACGYPTLIMTPSTAFPMKSSSLSNIVVNEGNLQEKLSESLKITRQEFFQKNQIEDYIEPYLNQGL